MARLWYEGFCNQAGTTDLLQGVLSTIALSGGAFALVTPGRILSNSKAMSFTTVADTVGAPAWWSKIFTAQANAFTHLAINPQLPTNGADATTWVAFFDFTGSKCQVSVGVDQITGTITTYQGYGPNMVNAAGDGLAVLGTSAAGVVPIGAYCSLEIGLVVATGTGGSLTVKVNSVVISGASVSGVQTQQSANASYTNFQAGVTLSADGTPGSTATTLFSDAYVGNGSGSSFNTYVNPITIQPRFPTANGAVQFTPKSGTNYQMVSETTMDGFTTYNSAQTDGFQDNFTSNETILAGYTPISVKVQIATASDTGTARSSEPILISGSGTVTGSAALAAETFGYNEVYADQDPNISGAWTAASVLASTLAYKQVS